MRSFALLLLVGAALLPRLALGHTERQLSVEELQRIGFDQRLDNAIPLDLPFRDESGKRVRVGDYFSSHPVILVPLYYHCPNLCPLVLKGLADGLRDLPFRAGEQFNVLALSIDPRETPALALDAKTKALAEYGRPDEDQGWHFLTGEEGSIEQLTHAIGFRYFYEAAHDEYAHGSAIVVLTGGGRIARYLFGVAYPTRDLRLALVEAADGRIGSPVDQFLLRCFHYDPKTGKYTFAVLEALKIAGSATVLLLAALVAFLLYEERRRRAGHHLGRRASGKS